MGSSRFVLFLVIAVMAGFAFLIVRWTNNELTSLRAGASSTASIEAESGVLSTNATSVNDANASDGWFVRLGGISQPITVTRRNDGMLIINGTPTFLHGFYHDADDPAHQGNFLLNDMLTLASLKYNLMHPTLTEFSNTTAYRQQAPENGIWTIAQFYQPGLTATVNTLKTDPGVIAYDIGDDFNMPKNDPSKTPAMYQNKATIVRNITTEQLTYGAGSGFPGYPLKEYKNAFDIIGIEAYPIGNKDDSYSTEMEESIQYYLYARQELPDRSVFALPQTFAWNNTVSGLPTVQDLRNMTWGAVVARVNGILHYSYYCCDTYIPQTILMPEIQKLGPDIRKIMPALMNGQYSYHDAVTGGLNNRTGRIHGAFWKYGTTTYIVVVNTAKTTQTATIPLPSGTAGMGEIQPLFPGDTRYGTGLTVTNNILSGAVQSYAVHAYTIQ